LRRYKAKGVKTLCYQEGVGQFEPRFQGEGFDPGEYFLVSTKLDRYSLLINIDKTKVMASDGVSHTHSE